VTLAAEAPSVDAPFLPREVVLATGNQGKAREFARLLGPAFSIRAMPAGVTPPPEAGNTFAENARDKATAVFAALGGVTAVLADDSGLEVAALEGLPGVRSARFAREGATDSENVDKLLRELDGRIDRTARFVCHLAFVMPETSCSACGHTIFESSGVLEGTIETAPRGGEGFGYDPVFRPQGSETTLSEMSPDEKNAISHRARAVKALVAVLEQEGAASGGF
jgi:XTP/dITP diphosphohydrolase